MSIKVSNETEFRSSFLFLLLLFTRFFTRFLHTKDRNVFLSKPTSPILLLLIVMLLVAELSSDSMGMAWAMRQNQARQQNYRPPQRARQHQIRNQQREQQRAQANAAHQQVAAQQQKFKELAMEGAMLFIEVDQASIVIETILGILEFYKTKIPKNTYWFISETVLGKFKQPGEDDNTFTVHFRLLFETMKSSVLLEQQNYIGKSVNSGKLPEPNPKLFLKRLKIFALILARGILLHLELIDQEILFCAHPQGLCMNAFYYVNLFNHADFRQSVVGKFGINSINPLFEWEVENYVRRIDVLEPPKELNNVQLVQSGLKTIRPSSNDRLFAHHFTLTEALRAVEGRLELHKFIPLLLSQVQQEENWFYVSSQKLKYYLIIHVEPTVLFTKEVLKHWETIDMLLYTSICIYIGEEAVAVVQSQDLDKPGNFVNNTRGIVKNANKNESAHVNRAFYQRRVDELKTKLGDLGAAIVGTIGPSIQHSFNFPQAIQNTMKQLVGPSGFQMKIPLKWQEEDAGKWIMSKNENDSMGCVAGCAGGFYSAFRRKVQKNNAKNDAQKVRKQMEKVTKERNLRQVSINQIPPGALPQNQPIPVQYQAQSQPQPQQQQQQQQLQPQQVQRPVPPKPLQPQQNPQQPINVGLGGQPQPQSQQNPIQQSEPAPVPVYPPRNVYPPANNHEPEVQYHYRSPQFSPRASPNVVNLDHHGGGTGSRTHKRSESAPPPKNPPRRKSEENNLDSENSEVSGISGGDGRPYKPKQKWQPASEEEHRKGDRMSKPRNGVRYQNQGMEPPVDYTQSIPTRARGLDSRSRHYGDAYDNYDERKPFKDPEPHIDGERSNRREKDPELYSRKGKEKVAVEDFKHHRYKVEPPRSASPIQRGAYQEDFNLHSGFEGGHPHGADYGRLHKMQTPYEDDDYIQEEFYRSKMNPQERAGHRPSDQQPYERNHGNFDTNLPNERMREDAYRNQRRIPNKGEEHCRIGDERYQHHNRGAPAKNYTPRDQSPKDRYNDMYNERTAHNDRRSSPQNRRTPQDFYNRAYDDDMHQHPGTGNRAFISPQRTNQNMNQRHEAQPILQKKKQAQTQGKTRPARSRADPTKFEKVLQEMQKDQVYSSSSPPRPGATAPTRDRAHSPKQNVYQEAIHNPYSQPINYAKTKTSTPNLERTVSPNPNRPNFDHQTQQHFDKSIPQNKSREHPDSLNIWNRSGNTQSRPQSPLGSPVQSPRDYLTAIDDFTDNAGATSQGIIQKESSRSGRYNSFTFLGRSDNNHGFRDPRNNNFEVHERESGAVHSFAFKPK